MVCGVVVEDRYTYNEETHLTVFKTSLFFAGDGFTVYDSKGELYFRVDSYGHDSRDQVQLVLMDAAGNCLLTVRRKVLRLFWVTDFVASLKTVAKSASAVEGFLGDKTEGQMPIFSARRSSIIGPRSSVMVEINNKPEEYHIEGSFGQRNSTIYNSEKKPVVELSRKIDVSTNMMLGRDAFSLQIKPGFDVAFAMGLVVVLDQIYGEDASDDLDLPSSDSELPSIKSYTMRHGVSKPRKFRKRSHSLSF